MIRRKNHVNFGMFADEEKEPPALLQNSSVGQDSPQEIPQNRPTNPIVRDRYFIQLCENDNQSVNINPFAPKCHRRHSY